MRYLMYAKTNGVEQLFYDSESGSQEMSIAQPQLKLELSKAGTLEFTILPTHPLYNFFVKMTTYVRVVQDNDEIFRGRVLQIEDTMYMERQIQCEGDLAYLIDSLQPPQQASTGSTTTNQTKTNATANAQHGGHATSKSITTQKVDLGEVSNTSSRLAAQFIKYIAEHNSQMEVEKRFTVGYVTLVDIGEMSFSSSSYRDTKSTIDADLLRQYGGYLQTRHNPNGPTFIDWLKEPSDVSSQPIRLGMNMIDLKKQSKGDGLFTVLVPIGDSDLTIASVNGGSIELVNAAGVAQYGKIYKTQTYNGITDPSELKKLGEAYMEANYNSDKLSFTIKAIDLHLLTGSINAIHVGSVVTVVSEPHGIQEALVCTAIEYDIQNPENNSYEIGDPSETMSQKSAADMAAAAAATKSASKSAGRAGSSAGALKDIVNRHAENIMDTADLLYQLDADLVQIHAKCIDITAQEKVTVTADTLEINARGKIDMTAGGDINMTSGGVLRLGDTAWIGRDLVPPYHLYVFGESWMQSLTIGGWLNISGVRDENGGTWDTQALSGFLSVSSNSFRYTVNGEVSGYLEDAVSDLQIVPATSGTGMYKLQKKTFYEDTWTDVGNFSSATQLDGEWSSTGLTYTVTATPQEEELSLRLGMMTPTGADSSCNVDLVEFTDPEDPEQTTTRFSRTLYLKADDEYCYITNADANPSNRNTLAKITNPANNVTLGPITSGAFIDGDYYSRSSYPSLGYMIPGGYYYFDIIASNGEEQHAKAYCNGVSLSLVLDGPQASEYSEISSQGTLTADSYYKVTATPNYGTAQTWQFKTPANSGTIVTAINVDEVSDSVYDDLNYPEKSVSHGRYYSVTTTPPTRGAKFHVPSVSSHSSRNIDLQVKTPQNSAPSGGNYTDIIYMRTLTGLIDLYKNSSTAKYIPIEATAPGCTGTKLYYVVVGGD